MADILDWEYESVEFPCIYVDANWAIYLEEKGTEGAFIHCQVNKWSHHKYKQMKDAWTQHVWPIFRKKGYNKVWAILDNQKSHYFAHMFGFQDTEVQFTTKDGRVAQLMVCYC